MPSLLPLFLSLALFAAGQQFPGSGAAPVGSCKFSVFDAEPTKTIITGPDDVVKLVHVIEQPDSPVEILSANFEGMWVSVANGLQAHKDCSTVRIRNRSDRRIIGVALITTVTNFKHARGGAFRRAGTWQGLAPGQEAELRACGSWGSGGATNDVVHILVGVDWVRFEDCECLPSRRFPLNLSLGLSNWP